MRQFMKGKKKKTAVKVSAAPPIGLGATSPLLSQPWQSASAPPCTASGTRVPRLRLVWNTQPSFGLPFWALEVESLSCLRNSATCTHPGQLFQHRQLFRCFAQIIPPTTSILWVRTNFMCFHPDAANQRHTASSVASLNSYLPEYTSRV